MCIRDSTFPVDDQAYGELSQILDDALERIEAVGASARKRLGADGAAKATVVTMLFDSPGAATVADAGTPAATAAAAG